MAIMTCVCNHPFQDGKYGYKRRVANATGVAKSMMSSGGHRCTVCGKDIIRMAAVKKTKRATIFDKKGKKGR